MELDPADVQQHPAVAAFIAELRHWREVNGCSQKKLASLVDYTPSYVNKVERGTLLASKVFAEAADEHLQAGRAIIRRWKDMHEALLEVSDSRSSRGGTSDDSEPPPGPALVVEHEQAELVLRDGMYTTRTRRQLRNIGAQPVTQYLIRIVADRYPGDPERSNQLYRQDPLTWEEISLAAMCGDEPMAWTVKHDRDAAKEVWLLFENIDGKFPLYPGETTWISYQYSVLEHKWGPWWSRAIRLPTRRLSMTLVFPARLRPLLWGNETSMTAEASPFHSPFARQDRDDDVVFTWSTEDPPLHARYRAEWKFRNPDEETPPMQALSPAAQMRSLDIVQAGDPILGEVARSFDLPADAEDARRVVAQLTSVLTRVEQVHNFTKGTGLAAPQIGIGRAAAVVHTPHGEMITLLNPQICDQSAETDEQYEGCLSFFDVRGKVPRPLSIEVEHQDIDGTIKITTFERGMARLVCHEVDHLFGRLYRSRMRPGVQPIPVSVYKGIGEQWTYQ